MRAHGRIPLCEEPSYALSVEMEAHNFGSVSFREEALEPIY